jgi:hypothetical protein
MRCPACGEAATVRLDWQDADTPHADISDYECATGCKVDDEAIRNIVGTQ